MKMRRCFGFVLAFAIALSSLGTPTLAMETPLDTMPISAIERASGRFNETVSAGKTKKLGSAISLAAGESVNFNATYSPRDASVDFGVVDSNNVFLYINVTNGSVDGGVTVTENGQYTPAIRNNSTKAVYVSGTVEC